MRIANYVLFTLNIVVLALAIWFVSSRGYSPNPDPNWKYSEVVSLLFTTATIVMAALTIVLAVVAILRYSAIRSMAKESAEAVAKAEAKVTAESVAMEAASAVAAKVAKEIAEPAARRAAQDFLAQSGNLNYQTDALVDELSKE